MPKYPTARNWATVLYPESCDPEFRSKLEDMHVAAFLSPLHDSDVDKYGELEKPHYHLMVMYENQRSSSQFVNSVVEPLKGVGAEKVESRRGYARYLCHLDSPGKFRYNTFDVVSFCGVDYDYVINSSSDRIGIMAEMLDYCDSVRNWDFRCFNRFFAA